MSKTSIIVHRNVTNSEDTITLVGKFRIDGPRYRSRHVKSSLIPSPFPSTPSIRKMAPTLILTRCLGSPLANLQLMLESTGSTPNSGRLHLIVRHTDQEGNDLCKTKKNSSPVRPNIRQRQARGDHDHHKRGGNQ